MNRLMYLRIMNKLTLALILLMVISHVPFLTSADNGGPTITDVYHVPKYPLYEVNVMVYATVNDSDLIDEVKLIYCDNVSCGPEVRMARVGSTDVFIGVIPWDIDWENGTVIKYHIEAKDGKGYENTTEDFPYFYVSEIEVNTTVDQETIYVRDEITLNGYALYNGNDTAPVEYSNASVRVIDAGIEENTTTGINGNFNVKLVFDSPGSYVINTTVTNRTLVGYHEIPITVNPLLISWVSEFVQPSTCYSDQHIWVNGTVRYNSGRAVINSDVNVSINETLYWTGKTDSEGKYSVLITAPGETSPYAVNVSVKNGSLVGYNETSILITEVPLPDLSVRVHEIVFVCENDPPLKYDEVNITAIIRNIGSGIASEVNVSFYIGGPIINTLIGSFITPQITDGGACTAYLTWTPVNGTYSIWVVCDPLNATSESFENNNNASKSIFVDNDFDEDGVGDLADPDDDDDGYYDVVDVFPYDPTEWNDTDDDGIGDNSDEDIDGDGIFNSIDAFPYNASEWNDNDLDGIGDNTDTDDDNDGYLDENDDFPFNSSEWLDTDEDNIGNNADEDDDNDGLLDTEEEAKGTDPLDPDSDGDGVGDKEDYDPLDPEVWEKEDELPLIYILIVVTVIIILVIIAFYFMKKRKPEDELKGIDESDSSDLSEED